MALPDDYKKRILPKEGTKTLALGPQAYVDTGDQRYVSDAYQYFLNQGMGSGQDATTIPLIDKGPSSPPITAADYPEGYTGPMLSGITTASAAQNMGGGAQNPLTQMVTDPATGQTQTVKQAMTSPAAYNIPGQMPKTPVSGAFGPQSYLQPQTSDPFLTSGAAGGASLPQIGYGEGEVDPKLAAAAGLTTEYPMTQDLETKNIFQKAGQTVSGAAEDLKNAGYNVVQQGKDLIANIGGKSIDIGKTIGTGAINLIGSKITGIPLLGTAAQILGEVLPERDPRQKKLDELYPDRTSAGTIASGLMKGYNPVSGGGLYTLTGGRTGEEPTYGLQKAYDKRISTIENTLKDKYKMSDAEIADVKAGSYKGDVDTNLLGTLVDLEDAKKKEASI